MFAHYGKLAGGMAARAFLGPTAGPIGDAIGENIGKFVGLPIMKLKERLKNKSKNFVSSNFLLPNYGNIRKNENNDNSNIETLEVDN
ncbi:hypothetical protein HERIO_559 [Hepatospora eriocheir]|uniref:Uncharacterized protein n=1 Tax=Hepatospora eriocheir TaxID=1081669 RepID=A0A1X0QCT1_9MICR|nr:hypothetical protein HERIO_559 [Hepatospora eriocheir]